MRSARVSFALLLALLVAPAAPVRGGEVATANLNIVGIALEVSREPVITGVGIPAQVQTVFGGKTNAEAPPAPGLTAAAELTGPGLDAPISLLTKPGHAFALPVLQDEGEYTLQNIRLINDAGAFVAQALPSFAIVQVTGVISTTVQVRQLSAAELRARGITIDDRNYEVYEYTFVFGVQGKYVYVPYPVIIDKRTHEVRVVQQPDPYKLPELSLERPPRFRPPRVAILELSGGGADESPTRPPVERGGARPTIPAAIVMPTGFGVLHQFFAVILEVGNTAPDTSSIRLDSITAQLTAPLALKVQKTMPAVALGQPVPVYDKVTGRTFLVAGAQGSAEWTVEALKAGTHSLSIEVNATYQNAGQPDFPLRGRVATSLVVSDPRFHVNFSHPDVVRKDEPYTAYAFISNLSPQLQHVKIDTSYIPPCSTGLFSVDFICRDGGEPVFEQDIPPGEMITVPYKLKSNITGHVYAAAGASSDPDVVGVSVKLSMGVSQSGIPLSPATLVMPHYARYLPSTFIDANMQLLGLGYSLATAPLNKLTAKFPRLIETDVFTRAQEIARAGQRIFIDRVDPEVNDAAENRDPLIHLSLDLLGNIERADKLAVAPELSEWDELRRIEKSGRRAGAAIARQLEAGSLNADDFADAFAAATSHRAPFLFALAEGGTLSVQGLTSQTNLAVKAEAEADWVRTLPYGELTEFHNGELALVGRWKESLRVRVVPTSASFTLHLIYPDTEDGKQLRTRVDVSNATPGQPVTIDLERGDRTLIVNGATATPLVDAVPQTPLALVGAAQDLHLDKGGHIVSLLFNRPIDGGDASQLRDRFSLKTTVALAGYERTVRNDPAKPKDPYIPGAAVQSDSKIIHISFDKTLSKNAQYTIGVDPIRDALVATNTFSSSSIAPRIDNNAPGAILTGKVVRGDNTPYENAQVILDSGDVRQYDLSMADGRYMFEFVPRDLSRRLYGDYLLQGFADDKTARAEGAVRLPGVVHEVNLVFLGRGTAEGRVFYDDEESTPLANATVTVGSTMFNEMHSAVTNADGVFTVPNVPVGPLTFSVVDPEGRPTYAANHLANAGQVVKQDLIIYRREFPGTGTVRVIVKRSDIELDDPAALVANARIGIYTQGYSLTEARTDANGFYEFTKVPAGLVSILAADFGITRESAGIEVDLAPDSTIERVLVLPVRDESDPLPATLSGKVRKDDPAAPSIAANETDVPNAIITIEGLPPVTADGAGNYVYPEVPTVYGGRRMWVFDPATGRRGQFEVPTLLSGVDNHFTPTLRTNQGEGNGTLRVRLSDATGRPVSGYRVIVPGFPPTNFADKGNGVYELGVSVPRWQEVWAVPSGGGSGPYGLQYAHGVMRIDFNGQIAILDLRLPGQGTVVAHGRLANACNTGTCYTDANGDVSIAYSVWDEAEQDTSIFTFVKGMPAGGGAVTFTNIPARQKMVVATVRNPVGFAAVDGVMLAYEGDQRDVYLDLKTIGNVTGSIFMHDRRTPAAGAIVRFEGGELKYAPQLTKADGSFRFPAIPANTSFRIIAEINADGIYRTGYTDARTPPGGGPVEGLLVIMREQSTVTGTVVDLDGNAVSQAHYWLKELAWPYRDIGTAQDPLTTDDTGNFIISNVFTGDFRITARSPLVQETRGDYQGELAFEGFTEEQDIEVKIGGLGTGSISVTVVDPNVGLLPVENAEVALYRTSGRFDFTTTNANGVAFFAEVPVTQDDEYRVVAYAKGRGLGGQSQSFRFLRDETKQVRVTLDFKGTVDGSVTDPETTPHAPVRGIPVTLSLHGAELTRDSTGSDGKFLFEGVPEGPIALAAFDLDSGRMAFSQPGLFISKSVPEQLDVQLKLELTGDINVKAYLPNDNGTAGALAPLVDVLVESRDYYRGAQGNDLNFKRMITRYGFDVTIKEIGGEYREIKLKSLTFAKDQTHRDIAVTFPSSGSVMVSVTGGANEPVADAKVLINGKTLFTPASGMVTLTGVPLGDVNVQASKGTVAASASATLLSRSTPLEFTLKLGTSATVRGYVEAEGATGPSAGTRVIMTAKSSAITGGSTRFEAITGADGYVTFGGVPVNNTRLDVKYYGPDDTTIGETLTDHLIPNGTTGTIELPRATLDATPPRVLSIDPPANATSVSPSAPITIIFSESIDSSTINNNFFDLIATDNSQDVQFASFETSAQQDGRYIVRLVPPAPPAGQPFALRSNILYRLVIKGSIKDSTGNVMSATVGSSFTTVNYTEPAILRVQPAESEPLPSNARFLVKFNKAIDIASYAAGNGGTLTLERLSSYKGSPVEIIPITYELDPVDPSTLTVAPTGVAIAESSFYRLTIAKTKDTQTPANVQKDPPRQLEFFSYDLSRPVVKIVSPVPEGEALISGVVYTIKANIENPDGSAATDVASVDFFDADGDLYGRDRSAPWEFIIAPKFETSPTFTIQASATDLSGNESTARATFTWNVLPNDPPANIEVTNVPQSVYPNQTVESRVTFTDEGTLVTVAGQLKGFHTDGSTLTSSAGSVQASRASVGVPFEEQKLTYRVPKEMKEGEATLVVTVTDSAEKKGTVNKPLTILADAIPPQVLSLKPKAESRHAFNTTYEIELQVKDAETGIAKVELTYDPSKPAEILTASSTSADGVVTFKKSVLVPPKNADTRVHTVAKVYDHRNNYVEAAVDVIWERVEDPTVPTAHWITPLDGAALPAAQTGWQTTLRVQASDNVLVTGVKFESSALAAPVQATQKASPNANQWEAKVTLNIPAGSAPFVIKATVSDGDPAHDVELPITIDPVTLSVPPIFSTDFSISSLNVATYTDATVFVRGPNTKVSILVPVRFKNLILVDGAVFKTLEERKVEIEVTDRLFIDADSFVDLNEAGYLGGLRTRSDNNFRNESSTARTFPGTTEGGPTAHLDPPGGADGSYGGIGGEEAENDTNATYGSITEPFDFGSGGAGLVNGSLTNTAHHGGNGGGALKLTGGTLAGLARFVVAGTIRADGGSCEDRGGCGSGGSIWLDSRALITGAKTRITANGGSEYKTAGEASAGGGGGRMSLRMSDRFDVVDLAHALQVRGGRNGNGSVPNTPSKVDGGSGTIFLKRPDAVKGELIVSSFDERHPESLHLTRGTPLSGVLDFDKITVGPHARARFDNAYTLPEGMTPSVAATAVVLQPNELPSITAVSFTPAGGSTLVQGTQIAAVFTASSPARVTRIRSAFSATSTQARLSTTTVPVNVAQTTLQVPVTNTATAGAATLELIVTDLAGRTAKTTAVNYTVAANGAPVITRFDVTPATEMYAGHTIDVDAAATDDIKVSTLELTKTIGNLTNENGVTSGNSMTRKFHVFVPEATVPGTVVGLTLTAADEHPDTPNTIETKNVTILSDTVAPAVTVTAPAEGAVLQEGAGNKFNVQITAIDAEVAVRSATAVLDGVSYPLVKGTNANANVYTASINVPNVSGTDDVPKTIAIAVEDYQGNVNNKTVNVLVRPLIDVNAPLLSWLCASPNAMYPANYTVTLRVFAKGATTANGVQSVQFTINGGAPVSGTPVANAADQYETTFTIPGGTPAGTEYNVVATATTVGGNDSAIGSTFKVVAGIELLNTSSTIQANETGLENTTYIVKSNAVLTIIGPRKLANLVVLDGGRVVHRQTLLGQPVVQTDKLEVQYLYVGCGGNLDADLLGMPKTTTMTGAGLSSQSSGASHIGRGGLYSDGSGAGQPGTTYGSVMQPQLPGSGGYVGATAYVGGQGGGVLRILVSATVTVDGSISAKGSTSDEWGNGAGGSIWLSTPGTLAGGGVIGTRGGGDTPTATNPRGGGGGGAVALEYGTILGEVANNADTSGGRPSSTHFGASGSLYLKGPASQFGELVIDNRTSGQHAPTELPSFGSAIVASTTSPNTATLTAPSWIGPWLQGHALRVTAPDGTVRGTWKIATVTNDPSNITFNDFAHVKTQELAYDGYLMFSPAGRAVSGIPAAKVVAVRFNGGQWQYDNDTAFVNFTPVAGEFVFATFRKIATHIVSVTSIVCPCTSIEGLPAKALISGEVLFNNRPRFNGDGAPLWSPTSDEHEMIVRPGLTHGIIFGTAGATIELEADANVQPGDTLRGVYRFDKVTIRNARVIVNDLLESTTPAEIATGSSLTGSNLAAPVIDATRVSIAAGADGPVVIGIAGAVSDPDAPIDVVVHNTTKQRTAAPAMQNISRVVFSEDGGFSIRKLEGSTSSWGYTGASSVEAITSFGSLQFRAARTDKDMHVGLVPNDTTLNENEPAQNTFRLGSDGKWQVLANGSVLSPAKLGPYTPNTLFRIEKTPLAVRWYVDAQLVHEMTANVPPSLRFDFSMEDSDSEIRNILYDTNSSTASARVAADGSFRIAIDAAPADALTLHARDNHVFPLASSATLSTSATVGVAAVVFDRNPIAGGRGGVATVTLLQAAPSTGAVVRLRSSDPTVTIPATMSIAAGQTNGSVNFTTALVTAPVDVTITAAWGGTASALLNVIKDVIAPTVTITAPAANAQFNEGSTNLIAVSVIAIDEDSGVQRVYATIDGANMELTRTGTTNVWTGNVPSPFIDGNTVVTHDLVVTAVDRSGNPGASAPTSLRIQPVLEAGVPAISWLCGSTGTIYPAGSTAKLRVKAVPPSSTNLVQKVELIVDGTIYPAVALAGDEWEYVFTVPAGATDGTTFNIEARATVSGGGTASVLSTLTAVTDAHEITTDTTIAANDHALATRNVIIRGGTTTIIGAHTFKRLGVYAPAIVVHQNAVDSPDVRLDITADAVFIACGASIDLTGRGFASKKTYPGEIIPGNGSGGSHIGVGGFESTSQNPGNRGSAFGSIYRPLEPGGGSDYHGTNTWEGRAGGGVVRIDTDSLAVDGTINANGASGSTDNARGGAGGSVWIASARISGVGSIEANGGFAYWGGGGGGAVALEYTDPSSIVPRLTASPGAKKSTEKTTLAGPGTIYVRGPQSTYGSLRIDSAPLQSDEATQLPSFGKGSAQNGTNGATLATNKSAIAAYFAGHWIEISDANGVKGTWRIATISGNSVTLAPNASETISLAPGDLYQGIHRFDEVTVTGKVQLVTTDPIRATTTLLDGTIVATGFTAKNLTVKGSLTTPDETRLNLNVEETLHLTTGAVIDVSGRGSPANVSTGGTLPQNGGGGAHIGLGGTYSTNGPASSFGSVYRPSEAGGGSHGNSQEGRPGGGIVRIQAGTLLMQGNIIANGFGVSPNVQYNRGGGGGSIWITAQKITATGTLAANGGTSVFGSGGGGAIAIEYSDPSSTLPPTMTTFNGAHSEGTSKNGGPGSIYVKGPASTYGDLRVESGTALPEQATSLPSLGSGVALAGSGNGTLVTSRVNIPSFFEGHWVDILTATGTLKGTWRVASISGSTLKLAPNAGEAIPISVGDGWRGVYLFDNVFTRGTNRVESVDPIRTTDSQTIEGTLTMPNITARDLTIAANATVSLTDPSPYLDLDQLRIETGAVLNVDGRGYAPEVSYPGATIPGNGTGGSHMGVGGFTEAPRASTYGSVTRPRELGGGSDYGANLVNEGRAGGGALLIDVTDAVINGTIRANGAGTGVAHARGGGGGSVWIRAQSISGTGTVEADGGQAYWGPGGGGAVAIEYESGTLPTTVRARPGAHSSGNGGNPGAGTVYTFGPGATYGDLRVDGGGVAIGELTMLPGLGIGTAQSGSGSTLVTDRTVDIPAYFAAGHWVEITSASGTVKGIWRIASIDAKSVTLVPNASETISIAPGDFWSGLYRFDKLTIRNAAKLQANDRIDTPTVDKDASSTYDANDEAPSFPAALRSQIVITEDGGVDVVKGPAGAVVDPDAPIRMIVTNTTSGATFTGNAAANGSFSIPIGGAAGDTFTIHALDSHVAARRSEVLALTGSLDGTEILSLTIAPDPVIAGEDTFGTVRLTAPARPGGEVITLTSGDPAAVVPATVTVPGGATAAQFVIHTSGSPAGGLPVSITATAANSMEWSFTINPSSLTIDSVVIDTPSVVGGEMATGRVILSGPAPAGGVSILLSTSDSSLIDGEFYPYAYVEAGQTTSLEFFFTTKRVGVATTMTVMAHYGSTVPGTLTITPCTASDPPGTVSDSGLEGLVKFFHGGPPANATVTGDGTFVADQFLNSPASLLLTGGPGVHEWTIANIAQNFASTDRLALYVLVNPCDPPKQIQLTWKTSDAKTYHASWGENRITPVVSALRMGPIPAGGNWVRLDIPARWLDITATATTFTSLSIKTVGGTTMFDGVGRRTSCFISSRAPEPDFNERPWVEDELPEGATVTTGETWSWSNTVVPAGGTRSHVETSTGGFKQHSFQNATDTLDPKPGDVIRVWVFLDPCNPPREIMLRFRDTAWSYSAYWGENLYSDQTAATANRTRIGPLPPLGVWTLLEVPVSLLGMHNKSITGMAFGQYDGRVWYDRAALISPVDLAAGKPVTQLQSSWQVDLGAVQPIRTIGVTGTSLSNFWVLVSDVPFSSTALATTLTQPGVSSYKYVLSTNEQEFQIDRPGRYVRVQLEGTSTLQVSSVRVLAPHSPRQRNLAGGRSQAVSQISTAAGATADRAVNGTLNPIKANAETIAETLSAAEAWWQVDLGSIEPLAAIELWNRDGSTLQNFWLFVSDTPFETNTVAGTLAQSGVSAWFHGATTSIGHSFELARRGRYVRVQLTGTAALNLAEVQVWRRDTTLQPLAKNGRAETMSTREPPLTLTLSPRSGERGL